MPYINSKCCNAKPYIGGKVYIDRKIKHHYPVCSKCMKPYKEKDIILLENYKE